MRCEAYTKDGNGPRCQKTATGELYGKQVCGTHLHARTPFFESNKSLTTRRETRISPYSSSKGISDIAISRENIVSGRRSQKEKAEREREEQKMIRGLLEAERRQQRETAQAMTQVQSLLSGLSLRPSMEEMTIGSSSNNNQTDMFEQTHDYDEVLSSPQDRRVYYRPGRISRRSRN
jgi:hypothetical protein